MRSLRLRVGRRGAFLVSLGVLYLTYGYGLLYTVGPRPPDERRLYTVVEMVAPVRWWAVLWLLIGLHALTAGVIWRGALQRALAFSGLMGLSTVWAVGLGSADLAASVEGTSSWVVGLLFLALMAAIAVVAGWAEPTSHPEVPT